MKFPFPTLVSPWLLATGLLIGCSPPQEELPPDVFGRWVTEDARYAERFFELNSEGDVIFGLGPKESAVGKLLSVESEVSRKRFIPVELTYEDQDGSELGLVLHFEMGFQAFRFENDDVRWTRAVQLK